jgi:hypothetical protein
VFPAEAQALPPLRDEMEAREIEAWEIEAWEIEAWE